MQRDHATDRYALSSRLIHWVMVVMVVVQLFIAAVMMASLAYHPLLLALHKPLGIVILIFMLVRVINLLLHRPPPVMSSMGTLERLVAKGSEILLYALMLLQPVIGWAMLSAAGDPLTIGSVQFPAIAPADAGLFGVLRATHSVLAYALFAAFTAHLCAVVFHRLVLNDGLLARMALWPKRRPVDHAGEAREKVSVGSSENELNSGTNADPVDEARRTS